ncbi:MAG TPA: hypothetical protein VM324_03860 [Egibacteraceae bacterium]|jgi:Tfp pilus assembly protein PilX|nr:hypothetical protein [Egibacteraceae bacterium]
MPERPSPLLSAPRRAFASDRGSVPLALLVTIIMAGLTTVVFARTNADQRSTRFDNEFTTVLHAAEAGVEEATFRVNNHLVTGATAQGSGTANGYDYAWTAARQPSGQWVVTSTGTGPNEAERTVVAQLTDRPIFNASLATHLGINFTGGNKADSYNSRTQTRCSPPSSISCFGIIASNGNIEVGSSSATSNYADRVRVHDWANPENNGPARCTQATSQFCRTPFRENVDEPLDIRGSVPLVEDLLAGCAGFPTWKASDHATGSGSNRQAVFAPTSPASHPEIGAYHCFGELVFDVNTRLPTTVTADNGLVVVVRDRIKVEGAVRVACNACAGGFPAAPNRPAARRLQIFTLAKDETASGSNVLAAVQIRQHAKIAAAIYAPDASCGNQQSNAQVEIYGALACRVVLNQGGWEFHYDEDLLDGISTGQYFVTRWQEQ